MYKQIKGIEQGKTAQCSECSSTMVQYIQGKLVCKDCGHLIASTNKTNKYGASRTEFKGKIYDSRYEAEVAHSLEVRKRAKDIKDYQKQVKIPLTAHGKTVCNYYIDFVILHNDGTKEYTEVKGYETALWKLKWKIFEAQINETEPTATLTIVKEKQKNYKKGRLNKN